MFTSFHSLYIVAVENAAYSPKHPLDILTQIFYIFVHKFRLYCSRISVDNFFTISYNAVVNKIFGMTGGNLLW